MTTGTHVRSAIAVRPRSAFVHRVRLSCAAFGFLRPRSAFCARVRHSASRSAFGVAFGIRRRARSAFGARGRFCHTFA